MKHQITIRSAIAVFVTFASIAGASRLAAAPAASENSEWRLYGNNHEEQFYSPLKQINDKNVKQLGLAWYSDLPTKDGLVGNALVADGVVYESGSMSRIYANDVRTGELLWTFDPEVNFEGGSLATYMGSRWQRGLALLDDKLFVATGDCRMIAVDRTTGKKAWDVVSCDKSNNFMQTAAPHVGGGKVFMGNSCIDAGGSRGYVTAFDAKTGAVKWRWYTMPGDPSKGFENKAMEVASKTWGKKWKAANGCAAVWEAITYDEKLNLVYLGVGGADPWSPVDRDNDGGEELYASSIVALNADTGEYVWHYKINPQDGWNYEPMQSLIADMPIKGKIRRVLMNVPKNGFFYVLDAKTGKFISAKNITPVNWASGIDQKTGRPNYIEDAQWWKKPNGAVVVPGPEGAHSWQPMAYNPATRLVYVPVLSDPTWMSPDRSTVVGGSSWDMYYQDDKWKAYGRLVAWDPLTQTERWGVQQKYGYNGGLMSTAGNLVFEGEGTGKFEAFKADTGEMLWSADAGGAIFAAPTTVEIAGEQYILVPAGNGGSSGTALTMVRYSSCELCRGQSRLLAFKLGGTAKLPAPEAPLPFPKPPRPPYPADLALEGKAEYARQSCETCHGIELGNAGATPPDLRRATAATHDMFSRIVHGGLYKMVGMPQFDYLTEHQVQALQAFVINQSWKDYNEQEAKKAK